MGCQPCRKKIPLKGQCHAIFCFWFFSWISFPPAPDYSIKTVSNFFENSRRYSQLKCQRHQWQIEKNLNQKNFNNFVWSPLGTRGNIYINFCLQVHFQASAAGYCSHYLPPVSTIPAANLPSVSLIPVANLTPASTTLVANCHNTRGSGRKICRRCRWYRWQICRWCLWYRRQFATGVIDTGGKFATVVVDTGGAPWLANISANFRKNSKWS